MNEIRVFPFTAKEDEAALGLEDLCIQGRSLQLKYRRPSFNARSELYDYYKIYCAKAGERFIGIIAGAVKSVRYHDRTVLAMYVYDLRVHPDYRRQGIGKKLSATLVEDLGSKVDCIYTLIHGQNNRAFALACSYFAPKVVIPLTYVVMPVYRRHKTKGIGRLAPASQVHELYLRLNANEQFTPKFDLEKMKGHVESLILEKRIAGGSIWSSENILAEQVVRIPHSLNALRVLSRPLQPFLPLPRIPKQNEILRSWFLYDLFAANRQNLRNLLQEVNNMALSRERDFVYVLLQNSDPLLSWIKHARFKVFTLPYFFLAKGRVCPSLTDDIYIDVRDL